VSILRRLTWWYVGIGLVSMAILARVVQHEWLEQQRRLRDSKRQPDPVWQEVGEVLLFAGVPATILFFVVGGWVLRRSLAPIRALSEGVERIQVQNLKEQLPRSGNRDELDRLTEAFNQMIVRLDESVGGIREFTLHASHELKTPLTLMRAQTETVLRTEASVAEYREVLSSQLDEIERLTKIVDGLTFLAKADAGQIAMARERVSLDELVKDSFDDAQVLAAPHKLKVELTSCESVEVKGDRHRLRQLLLNLMSNAVSYNKPSGWITMALRRRNTYAELVVSNSGAGIPKEQLPHVFQRFVRGNAGEAVEGCGLGLSIAQWIVAAHGGAIQLESKPHVATTVTVSLPLHET
jgi:heavy metal sensor kinase